MHRPSFIVVSPRVAALSANAARSSFRALPLLVASCAVQVAHADTPALSAPAVQVAVVNPQLKNVAAVSPVAQPGGAKTIIAQSLKAQVAQPRASKVKTTVALMASQPGLPSGTSEAAAAAVTAPVAPVQPQIVEISAPASPAGKVLLAQRNQDDSNQPAATPKEQPGGIQVPVGPDKKTPNPGPNAAPPPADPPTTTPPPTTTTPGLPPVGSLDNRPKVDSFIGDVNAAEGREITSVSVVGNRVVPAETILTAVRTQRSAPFSSRVAEQDRGRIDNLGFFATVQVQVLPDVNDTSKVAVTFIVTENRVVTAYRFEGNNLLKMDELVPSLKSKIGVVLNRKTVQEDVEAINKKYQEKGFIALVQSAGQTDDGTLVFVLVEAKISKIELTGLKKTQPSLIRRQIRTKPGDSFDNAKLQRDLNRLYDLNFFEQPPVFKVDDDPENAGSVIVTFQFNERRTGQFSVGLGFDSRSKVSGFLTLAENNLGGSGRRASASVEVGARRNFELAYGNPYIGSKNASYDISIYNRSLFRQPNLLRNTGTAIISDNSTLEEERTGGRISFTQPLDYDRKQTIIYGYRNERAKLFQRDANGNIQNVTGVNFNGSGSISAPSLGYLLDLRDLRIDPSRGTRFQTVVERGLNFLGGNTSFTKLDFDLRHYIPLGGGLVNNQPRIVLAGRAVVGKSLNQLPTFEQYYIGGSETVRGYNTDQQFGDNQFYGNVELRYRFQSKIQGVLFFDAGRAYGGRFASRRTVNDPNNPGQTLNLSESNEGLLTSFGIGVRLQTPLGPIRLDVGKGRDGMQTHFAFGPTF